MFISSLLIVIMMVLWGAIHSILADLSIKRRLEATLGRSYRLCYNLVAGLTFVPILIMTAWLPDQVLYQVPIPWRWGMVAIQVAAVAAAGWTLWRTDVWHFLGLRQLMAETPPFTRLVVSGAYSWVRHPLYFFSLVFLWFTPLMTVNLLALYLGITLYFYIGAIFEERKLVREFGEAYRHYQGTTPMLIPWKLR